MSFFCKNLLNLYSQQSLPRLYSSLTYKSSISLNTLYPNSSLKLTSPKPSTTDEKFNGYIPIEQLDITYSRSSGPGGQNVNKVNTKVEVRFHLNSASWISDKTRSILADKLKNKITKEGFLVFKSDLTRYQQLNMADCLEKIRVMVQDSENSEPQSPSEETLERHRRRRERASSDRLALKRERGQTKTQRSLNNVNY